MKKDKNNERRWTDNPKFISINSPIELSKEEVEQAKKKDKDFMQQLKKSLEEKEE